MKKIKRILLWILGMTGGIWCIVSMSEKETKRTETEVRESSSILEKSGEEKDIMKIALTFDDGPSKYTSRLSEGLKKKGVSATFSCWGQTWKSFRKKEKNWLKTVIYWEIIPTVMCN